jgi:transcriptional regulator with PAS, ATPase and Fis domain
MGYMQAPSDEELSTRSASLDEVHRVRLTGARVEVTGGPDAGLAVELGGAGVIIGSGASCELRLRDKLVSRRHLELLAEANGVRVRDLDSLNGTFFSGARVESLLLDRDAVLIVGDTSLALRFSDRPLDLPVSPRTRFGDAIAHSAALRHVISLLEKAAKGDVTVLLEGDSGTGKDVLAHALHQESARKDGPFVVVDCGAIPENLVESELFGHERGAFTGAVAARSGAFEQADGGTLFLDEVGELPLEAQPKLLRALESRSFRRVGGAQTLKVDVRVVAATNRRLREAVRRREFREDLFYRLAVVYVAVPRLSERPDDVLPLAESFLRRATGDAAATVPADLARLLVAYPWPGNARELRNVVERFATFDRTDEGLLFGNAGPPSTRGAPSPFAGLETLSYHEAKRRLIESFHREVLPRVVDRAGGSVQRAAEALGIPRASLYRMLQPLRDDGGDDG